MINDVINYLADYTYSLTQCKMYNYGLILILKLFILKPDFYHLITFYGF